MYNGNILQKKILKIPKGYAEAVNRKKTDDTMAKRQTIQWPIDRRYNGQKKKDRRYNGQKTDDTMAKRQTMQWPKAKGLKVKQRITIYKK
jgi:hypothetical protein